ncbi:constituent of pre-ribosomal particles [Scheffersomyces amazonensis]|uniref:constituent of pre-ribosomal particles n=1 Tax=Scheffersomyces amazonensis TaxID=1078765 RepID=UPI00315CE890
MSNSLEERLKTHSSAFDGLLSLIPAKYYYDDATQDQWQQKKKSAQELAANKRAKLDPESKKNANEYINGHATAKDVMDNKALTAKPVVLPGKRQIKSLPIPASVEESEQSEESEEQEVDSGSNSDSSEELINEDSSSQLIFDDDGNEIDENSSSSQGDFKKQKVQEEKSKSKKNGRSLSPEEQLQREENLKKLREKLASKISALKERRKAPGTKVNGVVKSREQILEERKRKEELKKELKRKRQEDEDQDDDDDDEDINGEDSEIDGEDKSNSVLFGNIVFNDGSRVTSDLTKLRNTAEKRKQKGPSNNDIKGHLQKLENKKRKLETLSKEDQQKQIEKDKWQRVMSQAEGVKVKDDEKLLKKALKRKEKQKLKSEIEWKERKQVVKDTVAARAKRREENLKARRENKGKKSKKQPKLKKFTGIVNKAAKKRAGFEGSAKAKNKKK